MRQAKAYGWSAWCLFFCYFSLGKQRKSKIQISHSSALNFFALRLLFLKNYKIQITTNQHFTLLTRVKTSRATNSLTLTVNSPTLTYARTSRAANSPTLTYARTSRATNSLSLTFARTSRAANSPTLTYARTSRAVNSLTLTSARTSRATNSLTLPQPKLTSSQSFSTAQIPKTKLKNKFLPLS